MSKRAEEKALEIFPIKKVPYYGLSCNAYSERDANLDKRVLFCIGYEQAEEDYIELAQLWVDSGNVNIMSFKQFLKCHETQSNK